MMYVILRRHRRNEREKDLSRLIVTRSGADAEEDH